MELAERIWRRTAVEEVSVCQQLPKNCEIPQTNPFVTNGNRIMIHRHLLALLVCTLLSSVVASATLVRQIEPIQNVTGIKPKEAVFLKAGRNMPLVLRKKEDLAKYFTKEDLAQIVAKVDLKKQKVLVFAWGGSGGDRLSYDVLESFPEQIVFRIKPGRTKDLRQHVHIYAVRSNVKWSMK